MTSSLMLCPSSRRLTIQKVRQKNSETKRESDVDDWKKKRRERVSTGMPRSQSSDFVKVVIVYK